jgi:hypothetical protein
MAQVSEVIRSGFTPMSEAASLLSAVPRMMRPRSVRRITT